MNTRLNFLAFAAVAAGIIAPGCSSVSSTVKRTGIVALGSAAGGTAGYFASDHDPTKSVVGAVAGGVLTQLALGEDSESRQAGFDEGYVHGQSDAIKRQYFLRHALETQPLSPADIAGKPVYYLMPGPEVTVDGRKLAPHSVTVRVIE